jgi:hypothetical protein
MTARDDIEDLKDDGTMWDIECVVIEDGEEDVESQL